MTWLFVNIPLMVLFVALWVGIPAWLVLKHPDTKPKLVAAPAVRPVIAGREVAMTGLPARSLLRAGA